MSPELAIVAALALPVAGALLISLCGRRPNLRETVTLATAAALLPVRRSILPAVLAGERPAVRWLELVPGLALAFEVEPLGMLFALVASSLVDRQLDLFDRLHARATAKPTRRASTSASPSRSPARWASRFPPTC